MQEREVSIGQTTHALPEPFFVIATQNPIEQEGTYPLPEAQLDRFMFNIKIELPDGAEEEQILSGHHSKRKARGAESAVGPAIVDLQNWCGSGGERIHRQICVAAGAGHAAER